MADTSDVTTVQILSEGTEIPSTYGVMSVYIDKDINKIPTARIRLRDGGVAIDDKFTVSESETFKPGKKITIKAGHTTSKVAVIFEGIVVKVGLKIGNKGNIYVMVECRHAAIKLATVRKTAVYKEKKDSEIISSIWSKVSAIKTKSIAATGTKHGIVIQYNTTNWDFILMRADINGYVAIPEDGKLEIKKPVFSGTELAEIELGKNLLEFQGEIDARTQHKAATSYAWDSAGQKLVEAKGGATSATLAGGWSTSTLADVTNADPTMLPLASNVPSTFLDKWASSRLLKSTLALVQGKVKFIGNSAVKLGGLIKLVGLSKKFNGKAYIGGISHVIEEGIWTTEVRMGLSNDWYYDTAQNVKSPEVSGIIPPMEGLTMGIVSKIHEDKEGHFRILLKLPMLKQDNNMVLARLTSPYASAQAGIFFMPEVNDEVIVGFLNNDPTSPIILGSVHSKTSLKPPLTPDKKNPLKAIVTKNKLKITFDDENKIMIFETPAKNMITLDDKAGKIEIIDKNKNKIVMDSSGILLETTKDVTIKGKNINLTAQAKVAIKGTAGVAIEGANVEIKANAKFEAKGAMATVEGSAMATLKGGATTTIKGGIVMIN